MKKVYRTLFLLGFLCYGIGIYWIIQRDDPGKIAFQNYTPTPYAKPVLARSMPKRIVIKDLSIDLPIYPAVINNNTWEVTSLGANYLVSSPIPGATGNSIIYAHNWLKLFGNLVETKPGDTIIVEYADKTKKTFIVDHTTIVPSTEASILKQTKDKQITLYTCTGFMDSQRFVVIAKIKEQNNTEKVSN
jgi:LPXTG-site transpeptidase (sortase) family protein